MSKERLEGAKKHLKGAITYFLIENDIDVKTIERVTGDIDLLILQAERVKDLETENQQLKDELETISAHNQDLLHEIRILKNKITTFNKIYDEQLRIDSNES